MCCRGVVCGVSLSIVYLVFLLAVYLHMELIDRISVLDSEIMHLPLGYNVRVCLKDIEKL